jgi:uracil-DNA glycosylase
MTPTQFVSALSSVAIPGTFNPYAERCPVHDRADGPKRRRANLRSFLEGALACETDTIWIARDLGYRGGRRTGVPLTDEIHLEHMSCLFDSGSFQRATLGPAVAERTAAVVWSAIKTIQRPVFLWNVFPLHPHEPDDPFSNRCHTRAERETCKPLLLSLLEMIQPRQIVAIGRDAQAALSDLGVTSAAVRHPSYGGQAEFMAGVYSLYEIVSDAVVKPPVSDAGRPQSTGRPRKSDRH